MLNLIVTFPQMEAAKKAAPILDETAWTANWNKWFAAEHKAIAVLEETAFALAAERIRRKCGIAGYYSDHVGLNPEYRHDKHAFVIEAWRLYPELIAALEDLQKLGSFEMHFETEAGVKVSDDWWHDDELELYNLRTCTNYDFSARLEGATA
ncbi:MAG: hypothetical protein IKJ07_00015 [Clostridia bacterium]|nr:hypothetical protein [Candidatus Saccharibacteria bacterium]MBR4031101.1 hypothetical protein [Clostridia bacterium]